MDDVMSPPFTPHNPVVQCVHVRVGVCDIAIPIDQVFQALPLPSQGLTALPRRSGGLLGIADAAGVAVPVVALERWLPLQAAGDSTALQRLLILQHSGALVGIQVDAVLGVKAVPRADVRTLHHQPDEDELFDSVVPASAHSQTLCILEVERLMHLTHAWCAAAALEVPAAKPLDAVAPSNLPESSPHRYAVFLIGDEHWAVPVDAVLQVSTLPAIELALGGGQRSWAISQWQGRKLPLVDISAGRQASARQSAPWMVLVSHGPLVLGLTVSACQQFVEVTQQMVAQSPDAAFLVGVAMLPSIGKLQILDVAKLFALTPEASISRSELIFTNQLRGKGPSEATDPRPYLVFDADQRYCSPVDGIVGVVTLPTTAKEDLLQGRPAVLEWRGRTIHVVNLPAIAASKAMSPPLLAVLVQAPGSSSAPIGIAIRSLCDWLPAHSAQRIGMRMGAMGELGLINAKGALDHVNLVVVDLAQMASLLG